MPQINGKDLQGVAKDAAFAAVGFGVLGFQRAQVRRREMSEAVAQRGTTFRPPLGDIRAQLADLRKALEGHLSISDVRAQLAELVRTVDGHVSPVRSQVEARLDELETQLPTAARTTLQQIRTTITSQEQTLRSVLGVDDHHD